MTLRELSDGDELEQALLVRAAEAFTTRDGRTVLRVRLGDASGALTAVVREPADEDVAVLAADAVVWVRARYERHERYGPQLVLEQWRPAADGEFERAALERDEPGPARSAEQMERDLRALLESIGDADLRALLEEVFGATTETWARFREAPAAKHYHQAYRHGLLEHTLTVAEGVSALAGVFPAIDRDLAVTGALLHDLGKLDAYSAAEPAIEMTEAGRLQGEIVLGSTRVRAAIERRPQFPPQRAQALLHIILSHHGTLAHGSPVVPVTREATLVHMVDNLGGRLGSFDRLERALPPGERWSSWDKALGAGAWFPGAS
ncbi:HD domain-containing protein [Conexibacter stalactiti]|uniref:HD domain-containing protein n=1 Tax=Conexibacter stalactiti TaxID=1940611 RepID=A0ABU4HW45_9ACTN|nr:HD domain-containing protein [Conexibacter stalactiti]MDW5597546.1 HD domain-containing protein [Conexibacter stalactiti]MEC5038188.1 HD domain-containing protein [Conexibacter stalactiti]